MTFFGEKRWADEAHPHEAPALMAWPMILLAVGSVFSGGLLGWGGTLQHWLEPVTTFEESRAVAPGWVISAVAVGVVAVGFLIALWRYLGRAVPDIAPVDVSVLTVAARRDLYGDAFNEDVFMRPGAQLTHALVEFDDQGVDGSVNALANVVGRTSEWLRGLQTGFARNYALSMLTGAALVAAAILAVQLW
jgi:NADH-quinone oxidoreductase subunit L